LAGVTGANPDGNGPGVWGESKQSEGVHGVSHGNLAGVAGVNLDGNGPGVWGEARNNDGVHGVSHSSNHAAVSGVNDGGGSAGFFGGNVVVTGTVTAGGVDLGNAIKQLSAAIVGIQGQVTTLAAQVELLSS
jgi:hypothetical protein